MITTRFGSIVTVKSGNIAIDEVDVIREDGRILHTYISELKADGGIEEIEEAIKKANEDNETHRN